MTDLDRGLLGKDTTEIASRPTFDGASHGGAPGGLGGAVNGSP